MAWVFCYPILRLVLLSAEGDRFPSAANYTAVLGERRTWLAVRNTAVVGIAATAISTVVGTALAWVVAYTDVRAKRLLHVLVLAPFVLPGYLYTIAWVQFTRPGSWSTRLSALLPGVEPGDVSVFGLPGIVAVLGVRHIALVYILTVGVLRRIPRQLEQASRASGVSAFTTFRRVTLPLALPGVAGGALLAFLSNLDNFGVPAVLGIPARVSVLSTLIYQEVVSFGPAAFGRAAVLAVVLGVLALAATAAQQLALRRSRATETVMADLRPRVELRRGRPLLEIGLAVVLIAVSVLPLLSMVTSSLSPALGVPLSWETMTLDNYRVALDSDATRRAIANSLRFAAMTAACGLVIGTAVAYQRTRRHGWLPKAMDAAISLPYAVPGMVIALAMIFAWLRPLPWLDWNPGVYGTSGIIVIAYVVRFTYYQLRAAVTGLQQIDLAMEEAARAAGLGRFQTWRRILVPLLVPALLGGIALVMFVAVTELTVSSILWTSGSETIGTRVYGFQAAGYSRHATALSTTLVAGMLVALCVVAASTWLWRRHTHTGRPDTAVVRE